MVTADRGSGPLVLQVEPYDLNMFSFREQVNLMLSFGQTFFAPLKGDVRIIAHSLEFDVQAAVQGLVQETALTDEPWLREGRDAYRRFVRDLVRDVRLKQTRYYLVAWPESSAERNAIANLAAGAFSVADNPLYVATLEPLFQGDRVAEQERLVPPAGQAGPLITLLHSRDFMGSFDFTTLMQVLSLPFPVAVAVDAQTIPRDRAQDRLSLASNRLRAQLAQVQGESRDVASEEAMVSVTAAQDAVNQGEGLHQVQVIVAVFGANQQELANNVEMVINVLSSTIQLRPALAEQAEAALFFTTTRRPRLRAARTRNTLSTGLATLTPFGFRQRTNTDGILWGTERANYPIIGDLWGRPSYNVVILGETGSGKTFGSLVWLWREVLRGTQVIMLDPQGNCKTLAEMAHGRYSPLSFAQGLRLNPLDIVYDDSMQAQLDHVVNILQAMLNAGRTVRPEQQRILSNPEIHAIGLSLQARYAGLLGRNPPLEQMPRLADLVDDLAESEHGRLLAVELARYVTGTGADVFNQPTNVDIRLESPVVAWDLQFAEEGYKAMMMSLLFGAIARTILHNPDRRRIIYIDEYGLLANLSDVAGESVARATAALFKRVRRFQSSVWAVDQNLVTFENAYGTQILENAYQVTVYHVTEKGLPGLAAAFSQLSEGHLMYLAGAKRGHNVTMIGNREVYQMYVAPSMYELEMFARS